jgi:hypothetical protein
MNRRQFLRRAGLAAGLGVRASAAAGEFAIVLNPGDPVASSAPVKWAAAELERALTAQGGRVHPGASSRVLVAGAAASYR